MISVQNNPKIPYVLIYFCEFRISTPAPSSTPIAPRSTSLATGILPSPPYITKPAASKVESPRHQGHRPYKLRIVATSVMLITFVLI